MIAYLLPTQVLHIHESYKNISNYWLPNCTSILYLITVINKLYYLAIPLLKFLAVFCIAVFTSKLRIEHCSANLFVAWFDKIILNYHSFRITGLRWF